MFSLHGKPSETDAFLFFLATELGKTVAELDGMSYGEYVQWQAYFEAKQAVESVRK